MYVCFSQIDTKDTSHKVAGHLRVSETIFYITAIYKISSCTKVKFCSVLFYTISFVMERKAMSQLIFVAHFLVVLLGKCEQIEFPYFTETLTQVLENFPSCHLKLIRMNKTFTETSTIVDHIAPFTSENGIPLSILIAVSVSGNESAKHVNFHRWARFIKCFLHGYLMKSSMTFDGASHSFWVNQMQLQRRSGEWPDHFLLFGLFQNHSYSATVEKTPFKTFRHTFARGLVLLIGSTGRIVFRVEHGTGKLNSIPPTKISEHLKTSKKMAVDLHGEYITSSIEIRKFQGKPSCSMTDRERPIYVIPYYSLCAYHILGEKYNFTFGKSPRIYTIGENIFTAYGTVAISNHNFNDPFYQNRTVEWIPYDVLHEPFQFISFQPTKSIIYVTVLTKPYDLTTWMLLLTSGIILVSITVVSSQSGNNLLSKVIQFKRVMMILIGSLTDQHMTEDIRKITKEQSASLSCCWLTWVFCMIVIVGAYDDIIFSLLIKGERYSWHESADKLLKDPSYELKTTDFTENYEKNGSTVIVSISPIIFDRLIKPVLNNNASSPQQIEKFRKFNKSLRFIHKKYSDLAAEMIWKWSLDKSPVAKFSLLDKHPKIFSFLVTSFLPTMVASEREYQITGYTQITPWFITRNFFHSFFLNGIAQLDESGLSLAFKRYAQIWLSCTSLLSLKTSLQETYNLTIRKVNEANVLGRVLASSQTGQSDVLLEHFDEIVESMGMKYAVVIFKLLLKGLLLSTVGYMVEIFIYAMIHIRIMKKSTNAKVTRTTNIFTLRRIKNLHLTLCKS